MSLHADIVVARADLEVRAALTVRSGEVVALLGPNGAGKSTVLHALAGLLRPHAGLVELDGRVLDDPARHWHVRPQERGVGLVVQDYALFPRMSVVDNVAFGLRARGVPKGQARAKAAEWLARMGVAAHARRRPGELSGGQAQRVALARALAARPRLLLLDEPLAALDAGSRPAVRAELRRHLADFDGCTVIVTHDPLEAMVLGDRLVVVEAGRVVQQGSPAEVARRPRTDYVARLVGLNLLRGVASGRVVRIDAEGFGTDESGGGAGPDASVVVARDVSGPVYVAFAPVSVVLSPRRPDGSARNAWPVTVRDLEIHGDLVRVTADGPVPVLADVTPLAAAELELVPGARVWASVKASEVSAYPAGTDGHRS